MQCKCGGETVQRNTVRNKKLETSFEECRACKRVGNMVWYQAKEVEEFKERGFDVDNIL